MDSVHRSGIRSWEVPTEIFRGSESAIVGLTSQGWGLKGSEGHTSVGGHSSSEGNVRFRGGSLVQGENRQVKGDKQVQVTTCKGAEKGIKHM